MVDVGVQASLSDLDSNCSVTKIVTSDVEACCRVIMYSRINMLQRLHPSSEIGCNDIGAPFDYSDQADDAHWNVSSHAKVKAARAMLKFHKSKSRKERKQS